jgi:hypothetical protein
MPKYRYLLIALAAFTAAWSGYQLCFASEPEQEILASPAISNTEFARLEKLVALACECQMQGGDAANCYQKYDKAKAKYAPSGGATACAPISTEMDCFGEGGRRCIVTGYNINAIQGETGLCRPADAQAVEEAYLQAFDGISNDDQGEFSKADEAGRAAIIATLKQIRNGERVTVVKSRDGCV